MTNEKAQYIDDRITALIEDLSSQKDFTMRLKSDFISFNLDEVDSLLVLLDDIRKERNRYLKNEVTKEETDEYGL